MDVVEKPWRAASALVIALALSGCVTAQGTRDGFRWAPSQGVRPYVYRSVERTPNEPDRRYRVDYDLIADGDGGLIAAVRRAARSVGEVWIEADIDQACRTALKAGAGELARITLAPLSPEAAAALGDPFMAPCAPAEVFFPMTDILNVALVQMSSEFKLADLYTPGDSARFPAFKSQLDRLGTGLKVTSPGGLTSFVSRQGDVAVVDWSPDPMAVSIVSHGAMNGTDLHTRGVERYAFRLEIDARSGTLIRAATPSDRLDLIVDVPGLAPEQDPRIVVTREVSIETTAAASSATQRQ